MNDRDESGKFGDIREVKHLETPRDAKLYGATAVPSTVKLGAAKPLHISLEKTFFSIVLGWQVKFHLYNMSVKFQVQVIFFF